MKRGAINHPKTIHLATALGVHRYAAVGVLELMWQFTAQFAQDGAIGRWDNEAIAGAIDWEGDADQLIQTLIKCRWLDENEEHRLIVHDWPQHAEDYVHMSLARETRLFADGSLPSMRRLSNTEKGRINKKYKDLNKAEPKTARRKRSNAHSVRTTTAQRAHSVRTALPSVPLPSVPLPGRSCAAPGDAEPRPSNNDNSNNNSSAPASADASPVTEQSQILNFDAFGRDRAAWRDHVDAFFASIPEASIEHWQGEYSEIDVRRSLANCHGFIAEHPERAIEGLASYVAMWIKSDALNPHEVAKSGGKKKTVHGPHNEKPVPIPTVDDIAGADLWPGIMERLADDVDHDSLITWLEPCACQAVSHDAIWLDVPGVFYRNWIANNLASVIADASGRATIYYNVIEHEDISMEA